MQDVLISTIKINAKGQITISVAAHRWLGLKAGSRLREIIMENRLIKLAPEDSSISGRKRRI